MPRFFPAIALLTACSAFAQWNDSALRPFTMNHRRADASPADVSFLLDAPAGKSGFIRAQGGHFVKGDGSRIRFWGVHLTDWSPGSVLLPPKQDIPAWVASLARFGVNCVRLHFLDLGRRAASSTERGMIRSRSTPSSLTASIFWCPN